MAVQLRSCRTGTVVSFSNIFTLVVINRSSGAISWKVGPPMLASQHGATPLPNGNLLILDDGPHRSDDGLHYLRILEIDPRADSVVWQYQDRPSVNFLSPLISNAQRLWNGNTLINEGIFGRFFEVTQDGDVERSGGRTSERRAIRGSFAASR